MTCFIIYDILFSFSFFKDILLNKCLNLQSGFRLFKKEKTNNEKSLLESSKETCILIEPENLKPACHK